MPKPFSAHMLIGSGVMGAMLMLAGATHQLSAQTVVECLKDSEDTFSPCLAATGTGFNPGRKCTGNIPCPDVETSNSGECTILQTANQGENGRSEIMGLDRDCSYRVYMCVDPGAICTPGPTITRTGRCKEVSGPACVGSGGGGGPGGGGPPNDEQPDGDY